MQWIITLENGSSIWQIDAYVQSQSNTKVHVLFWKLNINVLDRGKKKFGNRLTANMTGEKFTLKVTNAEYEDSGKYSIEMLPAKPGRSFGKLETSIVTVNVHGMFFSCC